MRKLRADMRGLYVRLPLARVAVLDAKRGELGRYVYLQRLISAALSCPRCHAYVHRTRRKKRAVSEVAA